MLRCNGEVLLYSIIIRLWATVVKGPGVVCMKVDEVCGVEVMFELLLLAVLLTDMWALGEQSLPKLS